MGICCFSFGITFRTFLPPGKIGLFGGQREGNETLKCVVREINEEIGFYVPPEWFELIGRYDGPDHFIQSGTLHGEVYVARNISADSLTITEGTLLVIALGTARTCPITEIYLNQR